MHVCGLCLSNLFPLLLLWPHVLHRISVLICLLIFLKPQTSCCNCLMACVTHVMANSYTVRCAGGVPAELLTDPVYQENETNERFKKTHGALKAAYSIISKKVAKVWTLLSRSLLSLSTVTFHVSSRAQQYECFPRETVWKCMCCHHIMVLCPRLPMAAGLPFSLGSVAVLNSYKHLFLSMRSDNNASYEL